MKPNIDLLRDHGTFNNTFYKWKKMNGFNIKDPLCIRYHTKNLELFYIGTKHTNDKKSNTFKLIKQTIEECKPNLVIIEGIPFVEGINFDLEGFNGEGYYAACLSKKLKIPYCGIEPLDRTLMSKLKTKYKIEDINGFLFLRMYKYFYKTLNSSKEHFFNSFIERYPKLKIENILKWFEHTFIKLFKYGKYTEYSSPYENGVITQQIGFHNNKLRDQYNMVKLCQMIKKHKRVVYVIGENHAYADYPVLVDFFEHH